jgi:hypothetical protein
VDFLERQWDICKLLDDFLHGNMHFFHMSLVLCKDLHIWIGHIFGQVDNHHSLYTQVHHQQLLAAMNILYEDFLDILERMNIHFDDFWINR